MFDWHEDVLIVISSSNDKTPIAFILLGFCFNAFIAVYNRVYSLEIELD